MTPSAINVMKKAGKVIDELLSIVKETDKEITELKQAVRKLQWSATAYGFYDSTVRACPECDGLHPDDTMNYGGGRYKQGAGHKPECKLAMLIIQEKEGNRHGQENL